MSQKCKIKKCTRCGKHKPAITKYHNIVDSSGLYNKAQFFRLAPCAKCLEIMFDVVFDHLHHSDRRTLLYKYAEECNKPPTVMNKKERKRYGTKRVSKSSK